MTLERAIQISGFSNPRLAASALNHCTRQCPLRIKIALRIVANQ